MVPKDEEEMEANSGSPEGGEHPYVEGYQLLMNDPVTPEAAYNFEEDLQEEIIQHDAFNHSNNDSDIEVIEESEEGVPDRGLDLPSMSEDELRKDHVAHLIRNTLQSRNMEVRTKKLFTSGNIIMEYRPRSGDTPDSEKAVVNPGVIQEDNEGKLPNAAPETPSSIDPEDNISNDPLAVLLINTLDDKNVKFYMMKQRPSGNIIIDYGFDDEDESSGSDCSTEVASETGEEQEKTQVPAVEKDYTKNPMSSSSDTHMEFKKDAKNYNEARDSTTKDKSRPGPSGLRHRDISNSGVEYTEKMSDQEKMDVASSAPRTQHDYYRNPTPSTSGINSMMQSEAAQPGLVHGHLNNNPTAHLDFWNTHMEFKKDAKNYNEARDSTTKDKSRPGPSGLRHRDISNSGVEYTEKMSDQEKMDVASSAPRTQHDYYRNPTPSTSGINSMMQSEATQPGLVHGHLINDPTAHLDFWNHPYVLANVDRSSHFPRPWDYYSEEQFLARNVGTSGGIGGNSQQGDIDSLKRQRSRQEVKTANGTQQGATPSKRRRNQDDDAHSDSGMDE